MARMSRAVEISEEISGTVFTAKGVLVGLFFIGEDWFLRGRILMGRIF